MLKCNYWGFLGACLLVSTTYAVDVPDIDMEANQFNASECIDNYTQDCLDNSCLTSDSTDCTDNCAALAKAKCEQQSDD
ncbi:MAG: hypothetical protein CK426_04010 [Legionella sp.]|nr:MAG: hypothetical protein CK423_03010 [Legionella sp.]PJD98990.1 MAG: hypothetical protein CK426_04010 [Legionella sp.]